MQQSLRWFAVFLVLVMTREACSANPMLDAAAKDDQAEASEAPEAAEPMKAPQIVWHDTYAAAIHQARAENKMALLWFYLSSDPQWNAYFEKYVLADPEVQQSLQEKYVCAKLTPDATVDPTKMGEEGKRVLSHPSFAELAGQPGLVIIDMTDEESPHFHDVVSIYPFRSGPIDSYGMYALLNLPPGTLTQRTLVWAVMTHPERPQSAYGNWSSALSAEAEMHSQYQAAIGVQGHHQWETRFQRIISRLPGGLVAQEVCAESWPHQGLIEAARECVQSWRQSSGHWDAVRRHHPFFGYDMKRGANGTWYATGIFGRFH